MKLNRLPLTTLLSAALSFVSLVPTAASAQNTIIPCNQRPYGTADSVCHGAIGVGGGIAPPIIPTGPVCAAQQKRVGSIEYDPYTFPYAETLIENTQSFGDATRPMLARFGVYNSPGNNNNEVQVVFCRAGYSAADLNAIGGLAYNSPIGQLATVYTQGGSTVFSYRFSFKAISPGAGSNEVKIYYYAPPLGIGGG